MDADTKTTETQETEQPTEPTISNADAKSLPWVQQMAEKLAAYERSEKERTETEANLAKQAELKKAEDEQRWQDVIKMREAELENVKSEHQKQMLAMNLKTELMAAGFNNRVFMQGAISTYDGDMDKIGEYVAELKADESNAAFLGQTQSQPAPSPPNMPSVTRSKVSDQQIVALEKSSNPEDRQKAREYLEQRLRQGLPLP